MRLADKVAIITAAGSGIGRASARLFAKEGARIAVADIDDIAGEETVSTIKANGGDAIFVHTDASRAADIEHLVKVTKQEFGKVDIFFNNVGIAGGKAACDAIDEAVWDRVYATNVKSIMFSVKYAVPEMRKVGGGVIINTGGNLVAKPLPGFAGYISSKGAIIALTKALAVELAPENIRVNCVSPSLTDTPAGRRAWPPELKKKLEDNIPLGKRMIKPEEIAYTALYLACDESSMTTGINIVVDGGSGA
jgi:NAD(P)-dependent dehydrogenase (short-subunit alcohol dehydrogenase family)